ncbi:lysoplasmalogenase, partial [Xanthomonas citri pv. citri]|nr:lysoplasmalogenase [Xanthomonas citri pv. citri]
VTLAALAVVDGLAARRDGAGSTPDPVVAGYGVLLASMAALTQGAPAGTGPFAAIRIGGPLFLVSDAVIVARQLLPEGPGRD